MTPEEKITALEERNPFSSASVGDPWEKQYPDVPLINEAAFEGLSRLIGHKARDPAHNCGALVLGEAGSGKTHLIGRLLEEGRHSEPAFSFAYIQPIEDPEQTYRYLLREIVLNLCRPASASSSFTQLDRLLGAVLLETVEEKCRGRKTPRLEHRLPQLRADPLLLLEGIKKEETYSRLAQQASLDVRNRYPEIPKTFVKVFFQYGLKSRRLPARDWLSGSVVDSEDAELLGVPDRLQASALSLESEARGILNALGLLLARYRSPVVVCFDRLENLETDAQVHALEKMAELLVDKVQAMIPVAFVRGQQWEERFRIRLNQHVRERLEANTFQLEDCTPEQGLEIVRRRLESVFGEPPDPGLFPLDREKLMKSLGNGFVSPRTVIIQANRQLREALQQKPPSPDSPLDRLEQEWREQYQTVLNDPDSHPPERERLKRALELHLKHGASGRGLNVELVEPPESGDPYLDFVCRVRIQNGPLKPAAYIVDAEKHHQAVSARLKRGIEFLEANPSGMVFYIRDGRSPIPPPPRWKATNEKLRAFREMGGRVVQLGKKQAASWYALALVLYAVKEGDVTCMDADYTVRPVGLDELEVFVREKLPEKEDTGFGELNAFVRGSGHAAPREVRKASPKAEAPLAQKVQERLTEASPMMIEPASRVRSFLGREGVEVSLEDMLRILERFPDRFEILPARDGKLILLKKSWAYAQD